ncbi:MT-A70 family methyltransferase [Paragemmobacter straminiformis]|uniref:DNA methyltransferase n=1 Tax=Paragemmobacter straminiformis TaxID=2045119 RepID=A0A842I6I2_9RHOB|nr:MT-A70 family methyltransferase [Gemmobacter straminiformis]MBC2834684.1 DNA methyltransferase [Gemmobacter straminiformis]
MADPRIVTRQFIDRRPAGGFQMIMADPPWAYEMRSPKGYERAPQAHYECMTLDEIAALPVSILAAENCLLWLWAVSPMLPAALQVIEAWGFEYKTGGHWVKTAKSAGKLAFGTGYLLRNAGEPFLIATRGAPRTEKCVRSVVMAPKREHSRKPDEAFAAAEALMPQAQRIELFSRQPRAGWAGWGNEAGKFEGVA